MEVLATIVKAVRADRFDLIGTSMGVITATRWTARHPDTVNRLVLYGGWAKGVDVAPASVREHILGLVRERWGLGSDLLADILMTDADQATRAAFVSYQRESATAEMAARILAEAYAIDLTDELPRIRVPTLVAHREKDRAAPLAQGKLLAELIAGARLEILPGRTHVAFLGDAVSLIKVVRSFLGLRALRLGAGPALTRRQLEVAALVAEGLTNRDIAKRLGIEERSAEGHVERIRDKLGFRSRAQIATWHALTRN